MFLVTGVVKAPGVRMMRCDGHTSKLNSSDTKRHFKVQEMYTAMFLVTGVIRAPGCSNDAM